ncbi:unnamed protein product [Cuscuta epithymum]|uniref:PHD-type domain-containing protein n=1 Tax=Cuscuta epithymum TaxID=186058 RepID=A0AAV0FRA6_9ASTE|nr:unnamed protein product [Cuscuta epithymum]
MANLQEAGEIVISSIRSGMKREFTMLMKARPKCGISIGQKRASRSPNVASNGGTSRSSPYCSRTKNSIAKKRKGSDVVTSQHSTPQLDEKLDHTEVMACDNGVEKVEVLPPKGEWEETKSDVVDGVSDDDQKGTSLDSKTGEQEAVCSVKREELQCLNGYENERAIVVDVDETTVHVDKSGNEGEIIGMVDSKGVFHKENSKNGDVNEKRVLADKSCYDEQSVRLVNTGVEIIKETVIDENISEKLMIGNKYGREEHHDGLVKPTMEDIPMSEDCKTKNEAISAYDRSLAIALGSAENPLMRTTRSSLKPKQGLVAEDTKMEDAMECDGPSSIATTSKLEMKMSKKVVLEKTPTRLRQLLETGLLEGLPVRYVRSSKTRGFSSPELQGVIRGFGILCYCQDCNGSKVVSPNQFEIHAGSANKRPSEYIYLDNGKTLRDVLVACKDAPAHAAEFVIRNASGVGDAKISLFCLNCKVSLPEAALRSQSLQCDSCMTLQKSQSTPVQASDASSRSTSSNLVLKPTGTCPRTKLHGRLTRKDIRMHKLVFEGDILPDGTALGYYVRGERLLDGYKKGSGIFCYCCHKEVSPSQFEAHAGCASRRKPYLNIYTSNGVSLHELSIKLSLERKSALEENDDLCFICADGGDLVCCDNCPRAFHAVCVSLPSIPTGTWYCKQCENMFTKEKFVKHNVNAIAAGRVAGIDALEQITKRCIRIVDTLHAEVSVCVLCRSQDFSTSGFGPQTVIICDQCEKEYHVKCLEENNMDVLKELPKDKWFCCGECSSIHYALHKLLSEGELSLPDSLLQIVKEKSEGKNLEDNSVHDVKWRLLSGKTSSGETREWLSSAVSIFHDCFDPIADSSTSRLDLIPTMVYGKNFKDQDFGGMLCAVLLVNSTIVSAGVIRIFGKELAELPLVATRLDCQGKGYFQSLFSCIASLLKSLGVKSLVLPAAEEAESIWTKKFGFNKMTPEELKQYRKSYQVMIFHGTAMLQKQIS